MDKNAIKKYAVWARNELIARVTQKAEYYEITEKKTTPAEADSIGGRLLTDVEKKQRKALIQKIDAEGFEQVMEEVAYTWFNRFTALRFMEVNNYLPSHTRVFTNEAGEFKPQILADAIQLELAGLDMDKVYELKNANKTEDLYKYLLIVQCNALSGILPLMFQKIEDYTELLLPDYLLREGSIIEQMITIIPEEDFNVNTEDGQIEIIGWLYQFYISEKHDAVVDPLHGKTVKKEEVPAATQLFTTDWVVRYLIDNSVGRYWIERNPQSRLSEDLKYFITDRNGGIKSVDENVTPQEITVFDPCVGSGHFLIYAFDVLMKIYIEYGYSERDAASEIVKNNLFGLDIDGRATQLAYFSVMMKARQYDRRFFSRGVQPNVYEIVESNDVDRLSVDYFCNNPSVKKSVETVLNAMKDAKEYGSMLQIPKTNYEIIKDRFIELKDEINMYNAYLFGAFQSIILSAEIMSRKYTVVATNPPYFNKYDSKLKGFINDNYKEYSGDLFSVFMYRNALYCIPSGYTAFMTPNVWMSIKSYESLRKYILENKDIVTLIQMAHGAFNEVACVDVCSFVLANKHLDTEGVYFKLSDFKGDMENQRIKFEDAISGECDYKFFTNSTDLTLVPGSPITAFSATKKMLHIYSGAKLLSEVADPKQGIATSNNNIFLRLWYEVDSSKLFLDCETHEMAENSKARWYPYNKGGNFRKWYGNNDYVVDWEHDGMRLKNFKGAVLRNQPYYFRECISWSLISSYTIAFRYKPKGHLFDVAGMSCYSLSDIPIKYLLALNNSCLIGKIMLMLAPTINYQVGNIANIPVIYDKEKAESIISIAEKNISIAKTDWDDYETSWDFKASPMISHSTQNGSIEDAYISYKTYANNLFDELCANELELNKLFLDIYGLTGEISPDINRRDISATYIYDRKEEITDDIRESYYVRTKHDVIVDFISYAVGCMFGRYSLDEQGLIFAGGDWDDSSYRTYAPDKDAIIPICDDEYFDDDIVGRFVKFVSVTFGEQKLEENLKFIADALGGKGTSRDVLRNYFMNEFYADHIKIYQKRPIYWLFDSGKKNGFKCLVYIHRYKPDTIARIRTDYVHEQQSRYRTAISDLEQRISSLSTSERVKYNKRLIALQAQATEIRNYEEKIHHLADQMIKIDLDDGVKNNYEIFKDVLAKVK